MPIYEYVCDDCCMVFEVMRKSSNSEPCPYCTSHNTRRKFSTFMFKFVGYPKWVDKMDDFQKRQEGRGEEPTVPSLKELE